MHSFSSHAWRVKIVVLKHKKQCKLWCWCWMTWIWLCQKNIDSLQMWILLVGGANTSQGHPVSRLLQQSLPSLLISSTKHTAYYCNQDGSSFPSSQNWGWWEVFETELSRMILKIRLLQNICIYPKSKLT
jgi:hypothetical protein